MRWFAVILGVLLVALGIWAVMGGSLSFVETREVIDAGPISVNARDRESVPLSPVVAVVGLAGGLALLAVGASAASRRELP
jgi:hypothetical protein